MPLRVIREAIPRWRSHPRRSVAWDVLSAWNWWAGVVVVRVVIGWRGWPLPGGLSAWLSWVLAADTPAAKGSPARSDSAWIFEPGLFRSTGFGPVSEPLFDPDAGGVTDGTRSVDQSRLPSPSSTA
jgi:hypothetical protein